MDAIILFIPLLETEISDDNYDHKEAKVTRQKQLQPVETIFLLNNGIVRAFALLLW